METPLPIVFCAGLSGARTALVLNHLARLGYFCMDSVVPRLGLTVLSELQMHYSQIAIGLELSRMEFVEDFEHLAVNLRDRGIPLIFLEADDDVLVQQLSSTRSRHPWHEHTSSTLAAIQLERQTLEPVRGHCTHTFNTGLSDCR